MTAVVDVAITEVSAGDFGQHIEGLAEVLAACVNGGASVHFVAPLTQARAVAFWTRIGSEIAVGDRRLWTAHVDGRLSGTVQLIVGQPENSRHRAEISKMLVHPDARRHGLGRRLMLAAEQAARADRRTLLVLDTCTGSAGEALYRSVGFEVTGVVPQFALDGNGVLGAATFMHKLL